MIFDVRVSIPAARRATYRVTGTDFADRRDQMSARGEWGQYGGRLTVERRGNPLTRVIVACRPMVTLPDWRDRGDGSQAQQHEWDRLLAAMSDHEDEHDAVLRRVAEEFHRALAEASPQPDWREVQRQRRELIQRHVDEQNAYDRRTAHGQNTGADLRDV